MNFLRGLEKPFTSLFLLLFFSSRGSASVLTHSVPLISLCLILHTVTSFERKEVMHYWLKVCVLEPDSLSWNFSFPTMSNLP